jgi:nitric oxide reductase NorD protein
MPLSDRVDELEAKLDESLELELYPGRDTAPVAREIASQPDDIQKFILHWVVATAKNNLEIAWLFAQLSCKAFSRMDKEGVEKWLIQAMDRNDHAGLMAGIKVLQDVDNFVSIREAKLNGLPLDEVSGVLEGFLHGLNGRRLKLQIAQASYTDTETLFVPGLLHKFSERNENFLLYKAIVTHQWAQTWFGTWRADLEQVVSGYPDSDRALRHIHQLELVRLDQCIARELPGLARGMSWLKQYFSETPIQLAESQQKQLESPESDIQTSIILLKDIYDKPVADNCCYQGVLKPSLVNEVKLARLEKEKIIFRQALHDFTKDQVHENTEKKFDVEKMPNHEASEGFDFNLTLDGQPVLVPEFFQAASRSIVQDLGHIPPEYLQAAGPGEYSVKMTSSDPENVWQGTYHEEGALIYNEWDFQRNHYRKNWCALRELDVHPVYDDFVDNTIQKYKGLIVSLRRTFEAMRGDDKVLKRQPNGEDVDIDAFVESYVDCSLGAEMSPDLFKKRHKVERDIAVLFMVDMSGSTKGWINDAERESLVLLCQALETLGDRYAIYGFSGMTRKRCEIYRVKTFDETYSEDVKARISGIKPKDYTRMGVAIRHFGSVLREIDAKTRLLITLSDGKPDDYDKYRGEYGVEDTRHALMEARRDGIHSFCITIDETARDYLPHMYGAANYVVIDDVKKLPLKVSDIYRKLTM